MNKVKCNPEVTMGKLAALGLKRQRAGKVHSKFNSGLNVQFDDSLLYIGCRGTPLGAYGMNIEGASLQALLAAVHCDDLVVNKGDKLIFYSFSGSLAIGYAAAAVVDLTLPRLACRLGGIVSAGLYKYLETVDFARIIGMDLDEKTSKHLELLRQADKSDVAVNSRVIGFFTGRGQGLTPSGDDLLIGFTLALMLFGRFNRWRQTLAAVVTKERTTMISVAYTHALLAGHISEPLVRIASLLDGAERAEIEKRVREVRAFGHTSGADTLFGFSLGLKFLIKQGGVSGAGMR